MKFKLVFLLLVTLFLGGCQTPLIHASRRALSFGISQPDEMLHRNLAVTVKWDEVQADRYPTWADRVSTYAAGFEKGSALYRYRAAIMLVAEPDSGFLRSPGKLLVPKIGAVPDHIPRLRKGDIVEMRSTITYSVVDFENDDAVLVLRILCRKADPNFEECRDALPSVGPRKGYGPTGTPYPAKISEYGFKFSEYYDDNGDEVRPLPDDQSSAS